MIRATADTIRHVLFEYLDLFGTPDDTVLERDVWWIGAQHIHLLTLLGQLLLHTQATLNLARIVVGVLAHET